MLFFNFPTAGVCLIACTHAWYNDLPLICYSHMFIWQHTSLLWQLAIGIFNVNVCQLYVYLINKYCAWQAKIALFGAFLVWMKLRLLLKSWIQVLKIQLNLLQVCIFTFCVKSLEIIIMCVLNPAAIYYLNDYMYYRNFRHLDELSVLLCSIRTVPCDTVQYMAWHLYAWYTHELGGLKIISLSRIHVCGEND